VGVANVGARLLRVDPRVMLTRNVPWKVAAVIVALLVWIVQAQASPEETRPFEGKIPVERTNLPEGHIVRGSLGEVQVTTSGPVAVVRGLQVSSFRAQVDLAEYDLARAGEPQELKVLVSTVGDRARIVSVEPSSVVVRLVAVTSKRMPVQVLLENQPPAGFQAGKPVIEPTEVELRGPADALREVASVGANVRFTDSTSDLTLSPRAVPLDGAGKEVAEIEIAPQNVAVAVPLQSARTTRTVGIVPVLRGSPAAGFWVVSAVADPPTVTVRGEAAVLDRIDRIETTPIDIGGANADRTVRAALLQPNGTTLLRSDASVAIVVQAVRGTRAFPLLAPSAQNVRADLVAELDPANVEAVLAGTQAGLAALRPEQVSVVVDLAGRGPGVYQVDVTVRPPAGTTVVSFAPARINVTLRSR
jgi:YbbR domain-containing protein